MRLFQKREYGNFVIIALIVSTAVNSLSVIAEWYAVTPFGSDIGLWLSLFLIFLFLASILLGLVSVLFMVFKSMRRTAVRIFLFCSIYFAVAVMSMLIAEKMRMHAFHTFAQRSTPIILMIKKFDSDHGRPPVNLEELIPFYLSEIPKTGINAYTKYEYIVGGKAEQYEKNPWVLMVIVPSGFLDFYRFVYLPKQNYPEKSSYGWYKRIDDWAFYYE